MNWKKNGLTYIVWFVYLLAVVYGVYAAADLWRARLGVTGDILLYAIIGGVLLLAGLLNVFVWLIRKKAGEGGGRRSRLAGLLEFVLVLGPAAAGLALRIGKLPEMSGAQYFEMAAVKAGQGAPALLHGAEDLYVRLLHGICFVLGNNLFFCVCFHLALQMIAGLVCVLGARRMSGKATGIVFACAYFLNPHLIGESVILAPQPLFFLLFGLGLLCVGGFLQRSDGWPGWYALTGAVIAVLSYLDVSGLVLLGMLVTVLYVQREKAYRLLNRPLFSLLIALLAFAGVFFGIFALDALLNESSFGKVFGAWGNLFFLGLKPPVNLMMHLLHTKYGLEWGSALLALGAVGIFSFFFPKKEERSSAWILACGILAVFGICGVMAPGMDGSYVFLLCLSALAGAALSNYRRETVRVEGMRKWDPSLYGVNVISDTEEEESTPEENVQESGEREGEARRTETDFAVKERDAFSDRAASEEPEQGAVAALGQTWHETTSAGIREEMPAEDFAGPEEDGGIFEEEDENFGETRGRKKFPIGFLANILEERRRKKEQQQRDIEKVMNALTSLSNDRLVSVKVEGIREQVPEEKTHKEAKTRRGSRAEKADKPAKAQEVKKTKSEPEKKESKTKEKSKMQWINDEYDERMSDGRKPLHNPLPVPKKKEASPLEYDYDVSDDDDYDYD